MMQVRRRNDAEEGGYRESQSASAETAQPAVRRSFGPFTKILREKPDIAVKIGVNFGKSLQILLDQVAPPRAHAPFPNEAVEGHERLHSDEFKLVNAKCYLAARWLCRFARHGMECPHRHGP